MQRSPLLINKRLPCFVGIDISEDQLNIPCRPEPTLIVLEATGGWQWALVATLVVAELPFSVVNPR
jgi:hypothetical protein